MIWPNSLREGCWILGSVRKEFGLGGLYVTSTGGGRQLLTYGTTGRCGVPLTTLLLHVNLSTVWRHLLAFVAL